MNKWMQALPDNMNIADITLPGTHNSCTRNVDFIYFTKCQDMYIYEQLQAGIRLLDVRIELDGDNIKTVHSVIDCRKKPFGREKLLFDGVLADIRRFLAENPSEAVLVCVNRDDGAPSDVTFATFYRKYIENSALWFTENRFPELHEIRGKAVLLNRCTVPPELAETPCGLDFSQWESSDTVKCEFKKAYLKRSGDTRGYYLQDTYKAPPKIKWETAVKPFIESAPSEKCTIINFFSANDAIHSPRITAKYVNGRFLSYQTENRNKLGWLVFDFPTVEVIEKTVKVNFK